MAAIKRLEKTPAAGANGAVKRDPPADVPPTSAGADLQTLHGVPTFAALQSICSAYLGAHEYRKYNGSLYGACSCGVEFGSVGQWREHVTELQASALSFAIQESRLSNDY
jgi:hypothetical protein